MGSGEWRWPSTGFVLLVLAGVLWGTTGVAANGVFERTDLSPLATAWLRFAVATPLILAVAVRSMGRGLLRMPARTYLTLAGIGVLIFLCQVLYLQAISEIGVTVATLVMLCGIPPMVAAISAGVLGERLGRAMWAALALAVTGTALLVLGKPAGGAADGSLVLGVTLAVASAGAAAAFTLGSRALRVRADPLQISAASFLGGLLMFAPVTATGGFTLDIPVGGWLLILYLGVVTQGVAFLMFQRALQTETATTASVVTLLEPLVAALMAWMLFDERLGALSWGGAGLLIGALALLTVATTRGGEAGETSAG